MERERTTDRAPERSRVVAEIHAGVAEAARILAIRQRRNLRDLVEQGLRCVLSAEGVELEERSA